MDFFSLRLMCELMAYGVNRLLCFVYNIHVCGYIFFQCAIIRNINYLKISNEGHWLACPVKRTTWKKRGGGGGGGNKKKSPLLYWLRKQRLPMWTSCHYIKNHIHTNKYMYCFYKEDIIGVYDLYGRGSSK